MLARGLSQQRMLCLFIPSGIEVSISTGGRRSCEHLVPHERLWVWPVSGREGLEMNSQRSALETSCYCAE